jgi:hypothetical protein
MLFFLYPTGCRQSFFAMQQKMGKSTNFIQLMRIRIASQRASVSSAFLKVPLKRWTHVRRIARHGFFALEICIKAADTQCAVVQEAE